MHELLRQYGEDTLSLDPLRLQRVREQHAAYYVAAAVCWETGLKGMRGHETLAEMGVEIHNVQAAWQWLSEQGDAARQGQRMYPSSMIHSIGQFYMSRGLYQQGGAFFGAAAARLLMAAEAAVTPDTAVLRMYPSSLHVKGKLLTWQGRCAFLSGHGAQAAELLRQAQAALDDAERAGQDVRAARAWVLHSMWEQIADTDRTAFRPLAEQSLALYRELDDPWGIVYVLSDLGITSFLDGAYPLARQMFEERLALAQKRAISDGIGDSIWWLSWIAGLQGEVNRAERMARDLTAPWLASDDPMTRAGGLWLLGSILEFAGQYSAAKPLLEEGVALLRELGADVLLYRLLIQLISTELNLGQYERARELGREDVERARHMEAWVFVGLALIRLAQASVVMEAYQEAAQTLEESIALLRRAGASDFLGRGLGCMAYVARALGQADQAWKCVVQALRLAVECQAIYPLLMTLPAAALLLTDQGQVARAAELYALAWRHPVVSNSRWFEDVAGRHLATVAAELPPEVRAAAQARGLARDLWATARELLKELGA
jgi:tetratricopeptide (TPR) repeat protein